MQPLRDRVTRYLLNAALVMATCAAILYLGHVTTEHTQPFNDTPLGDNPMLIASLCAVGINIVLLFLSRILARRVPDKNRSKTRSV